MADANLQTMRYDQIRTLVKNHYQTLLDQFRERVNLAGRPGEANLAIRSGSMAVAGGSLDEFVSLACQGDLEGFVSRFCEMYGVEGELSAETQQKLLEEIQTGQRDFLEATVAFDSSLDSYEFDKPDLLLPHSTVLACFLGLSFSCHKHHRLDVPYARLLQTRRR